VRIAAHNKLVTSEQVDECVQAVLDEVIAGRIRPSLASVFIEKEYLSAAAAKAILDAVAKKFGDESPGSAAPPRKRTPAPVGDSQVLVPVKDRPAKRDRRFLVSTPEHGRSASLTVGCHHLSPGDGPALEAYCRQLLATGRKRLNVDMRRVGTVPSLVIGILVKAAADAKAAGQQLVLHCSEATGRVVRMMSGSDIEVRTGNAPPEAQLRI
jgi:hypothetical protein